MQGRFLKVRILKRISPRFRGNGLQITRDTGWLMAGQLLSVVFQAAYFLSLARLLGVSEYGVFAGVFAFTSIVAQYSSLGMGTVLLRYVACAPGQFRVYWGSLLFTTLVVGGLLTVWLRLVGPLFLDPAGAGLVIASALANCICFQLVAECGRIFQCFRRMSSCALLQLSVNGLRAIAAVGMLGAIGHASAWQWALCALGVSALGCLTAVGAVLWQFGTPRLRFRMIAERAGEGLGYAFATSSSVLYNDLDKALLNHYDLNLANGIYTMAYRVIDIATIPLYALRDAILPDLFRKGRRGIGGTAVVTTQLLKRLAAPAALSFLMLILTAPLSAALLGPGFAETVLAIRWLSLIPALRAIHLMTGTALTGAGYQGRRTVAQLAAACLNLCLNLFLIPRFGWLGSAWASLATDASLAAACWLILAYTMSEEGCSKADGFLVDRTQG